MMCKEKKWSANNEILSQYDDYLVVVKKGGCKMMCEEIKQKKSNCALDSASMKGKCKA